MQFIAIIFLLNIIGIVLYLLKYNIKINLKSKTRRYHSSFFNHHLF